MHRRRLLSIACLHLALAVGTAAQSVWIVDSSLGPGTDFTIIQGAIQAAAPGDVILVRPGDYGNFLVNKGVKLMAEPGAPAPVISGICRVTGVPGGQSAVISGLEATSNPIPGFTLAVTDNTGSVRLQRCSLLGVNNPVGKRPALDVRRSPAVSLSNCRLSVAEPLLGGDVPSCLRAEDAVIAMYDCDVDGGDGREAIPGADGEDGGIAVEVLGGLLFVSSSELNGGAGGAGRPAADPEPCGAAGDGGPGLRLGINSPLVTRQATSVIGGPGGAENGCTAGTQSPPVVLFSGGINALPDAAPRGFTLPSPVREGQTYQASFAGLPGDLVFWVGSLSDGWFLDPFLLNGVLLSGVPFASGFVGVTDGSGQLSASGTVGDLGPGVLISSLYLQALYFNPLERQRVLSAGEAIVWLDASVP